MRFLIRNWLFLVLATWQASPVLPGQRFTSAFTILLDAYFPRITPFVFEGSVWAVAFLLVNYWRKGPMKYAMIHSVFRQVYKKFNYHQQCKKCKHTNNIPSYDIINVCESRPWTIKQIDIRCGQPMEVLSQQCYEHNKTWRTVIKWPRLTHDRRRNINNIFDCDVSQAVRWMIWPRHIIPVLWQPSIMNRVSIAFEQQLTFIIS